MSKKQRSDLEILQDMLKKDPNLLNKLQTIEAPVSQGRPKTVKKAKITNNKEQTHVTKLGVTQVFKSFDNEVKREKIDIEKPIPVSERMRVEAELVNTNCKGCGKNVKISPKLLQKGQSYVCDGCNPVSVSR